MREFLLSRSGLVLLGFLGVTGYFLWAEHQAHVIAALPWLLVGGCLVMHLFMHHGHGGHGDDHHSDHDGPSDGKGDS
jgi:hypothetical protein